MRTVPRVMAFNDDAGGDPGSETEPYDAGLTFTAPTDGLYYIAVGRYSGGTFLNATSEYTLHVSVTEPGPSPALGTDGTGAKDILWGGAGDDQIFGGLGSDESWGEAGDDILEGGLGNDTLDGGADNDQLYGANGHDTLRGGSGDDLLNPWTGNDTLDGGEGVDTVDYSDFGSAISVNLLDLAPQLVSNAAGTDQFANIENILGSKGGDTLTGSHGNNRIEGGGGNDTIFGQKGDDVILGGAQNDTLRGNNGDDILIGGLGRDIMGGGRGADVFVFQDPSETVNGGFRDRIQDFNRNEDLLDLSAMDADLTSAVDSFTFMNNAAFTSGAGGQLRAFKVTATNKTIVEGEVDGDGKKDFQFELTGLINLTADHFIL
ncbi:MAG: calcium-binding protein [Pseudomonadota bacterium]